MNRNVVWQLNYCFIFLFDYLIFKNRVVLNENVMFNNLIFSILIFFQFICCLNVSMGYKWEKEFWMFFFWVLVVNYYDYFSYFRVWIGICWFMKFMVRLLMCGEVCVFIILVSRMSLLIFWGIFGSFIIWFWVNVC